MCQALYLDNVIFTEPRMNTNQWTRMTEKKQFSNNSCFHSWFNLRDLRPQPIMLRILPVQVRL